MTKLSFVLCGFNNKSHNVKDEAVHILPKNEGITKK